ncbi:MAG: sulfate ABC transporter permease subunit CysW [Candidatus Accumulibacter sp.]|jgi:sulfate transport system permease protein|nr:sulfate ABC transporter permease subunit CysW [Accumulibacter sp.]
MNGAIEKANAEPRWLRALLLFLGLGFLFFFLFVPLVAVFVEAFRSGWNAYADALGDRETLHAIKLTIIIAFVVLPVNVVLGVAASWAIAKFDFRGKGLLVTLIDLPFAVSPVVVGLVFLLIFGMQGLLGPWLEARGIKVVFALPGMILVTLFITFPFIARELIPLMLSQGADDEEAAISLGASGVQMFFRVTLPKIRWGLLYGVILANARAMGEFGAVSVVSGHIRGETNTLPLHVEILYNEYNAVAAFASASILALLALVTLAAKMLVEWRMRRENEALDAGFLPEGGISFPSRP